MVERAFFVGVGKYRLDWRSCCRGERESGWRTGVRYFLNGWVFRLRGEGGEGLLDLTDVAGSFRHWGASKEEALCLKHLGACESFERLKNICECL